MALKAIKSVDVMSAAKMYAVMMGAVGFFLGAFVAVIYGIFLGGVGMLGLMAGGNFAGMSIVAVIVGIIMLIVLVVVATISQAIIGFISGAIGAFIYNFFAKRVGGIKIELE